MHTLQGKKILLGISGSIAAYKAAHLTRLLIKAGAEVQILMTETATRFISPLTLSTLSKRPVFTQVASEEGWNNHVDLGLWADAMIVAPATATTLAKMASGLCDNMVVATYLSARCPVFFAPAMDLDMWVHPATQRNVDLLQSYGNQLIPVGDGELASGLVGKGRMAEPEEILALLDRHFSTELDWQGQRFLITAGPTYEAIDPVRFIGNRSSGKMGIALAEVAARAGAQVTLILGPTHLRPELSEIEVIAVQSAAEMHQAAMEQREHYDVAILAAAVADFRPQSAADQKIKKKPGQTEMTITLEKTKDIAAELGKTKTEQQLLIGFALETQNELTNAQAKLDKKNFDFIVLNSLRDAGAGFNHDTNKVKFLFRDGKQQAFSLKSKKEVAADILAAAHQLCSK